MLKRFVSAFLCVMLALTTTAVNFASSPGYSVEAAADFEIPYYYNQLSENAKMIYNKLKAAALECRKEVTIDDIEMNNGDFEMIVELLMMHNPVTFNVYDLSATTTTTTYKYSSQKKTQKKSITFDIEYTYSKAVYDKMVSAYEKKVDNILSKLTDDMNKYKKIRVIHDEIVKNTVYDLENPASGTIYGALVDKEAKCDGYAKTFSYICAKAGIQAVTVLGTAARSDGETEYHMWNKVCYNQKWYNVDVTWDDPKTSMKANCSHEYFMISDAEIGKNHVEDNMNFTAPKASDNSLNYYKINKKYADSLSSSKALMTSGITSAARNNSTYYEFKCSSRSVYNEVMKYIGTSGNVSEILKNAKKNSGKKIAANIYSYIPNDNLYVIRIIFFYEGTDLDDYYTDPDSVDSQTLKSLAKIGIT